MWFATKDGLNRYDGYTFKVYRNTGLANCLTDNWVQDMAEDSSGNFWVLTASKGLFLFNRKTEKFYSVTLPQRSKPKPISWFYISVQDSFLYISSDQGIFIYKTAAKLFTDQLDVQAHSTFCYQLNKQCFYKLKLTPNGGIWISKSERDSMYLFLPNKERTVWQQQQYSLKQYQERAISPQMSTGFDFVDQNRWFVFRNQKLTLYDYTSPQPIKEFTFSGGVNPNFHMYIEATRELKFNFENIPCVFKLNLNTMMVTRLTAETHSHIQDQYKDATHVIWSKTNGYGLSLLTNQEARFKRFFLPVRCGGIPNSIYHDKIEGGVYTYDLANHKRTQLLSKQQYHPNGNYNHLILDEDSVLWMSYTSLSCRFYSYDLKTRKLKHIHGNNNGVFDYLFEGETNRLWVFEVGQSSVRLLEYNKKEHRFLRSYKLPDKLGYTIRLYDVCRKQNNVFWIASSNGLIRFSPNSSDSNEIWKIFTHHEADPKSLSENKLLTVCADPKEPDRYLWIGTEGKGVERFTLSKEKFEHITEMDGLPNNVAYGILPDRQGNLWISTNRGLSCYTPRIDGYSKGVFRNFTKEDGLPGNEFNRYEFYQAPNYELEFSGVNGGVRFLPEQILTVEKAVPVCFISLHVNNKLVEVGDSTGILNKTITYTKTITLNHLQNIFILKFASLDYRNTNGKKYQYYLEGFNTEWTHPSPKNEASFTNLNPGTYTFHLKGSNCDGVWNEHETVLEIIILPRWYQTWLFRIGCLLFVVIMIYTFYRYKLKQVTRLHNLRNNIASDLHDELGSTLSSISLSATVIEDAIGEREPEAKILLQQVSKNVHQMMESMSDIVWTINTKNDSFRSIVQRMRVFAADMLEPNNIDFDFDVQSEVVDMKLNMHQRKNIYLVFKEAIHNAVKYAHAKHIVVRLERDNAAVKLNIIDDGIGFKVDETTNEMGGNGLYNIRRRAEELNGKVTITSVPGGGTNIEFQFKL